MIDIKEDGSEHAHLLGMILSFYHPVNLSFEES